MSFNSVFSVIHYFHVLDFHMYTLKTSAKYQIFSGHIHKMATMDSSWLGRCFVFTWWCLLFFEKVFGYHLLSKETSWLFGSYWAAHSKCGPFVIHHVGTFGSNLHFFLLTSGYKTNLIILVLKQAKSNEKGLHQKCTYQCLFYCEMTP